MARINPVQILNAFTPFVTENGGIKETVDQPQFKKIYELMRNCSTKLVSKCVYYQILISTSPNVLEQFLKIGGWDLICLWVKSSRDIGNVTFLLDLLKLLHILPMNIDRLRENECPKIVKKLCKHENKEIALKANQIIDKWTKIVHQLSEKNPSGSNGVNSSSNSQNKEKKRKSSDANYSTSDSKKLKADNENTNNNELRGMNSTDDSGDKTKGSASQLILIKRPVTAKVKAGKSRADFFTTTTTTKPNEKIKKKNKTMDEKKLLKNSLKTNTISTIKSPTPPASKNVLKDSMSFMDALSMVPVVGVKKRRKLNKDGSSENNKMPGGQENKSNHIGENVTVSSIKDASLDTDTLISTHSVHDNFKISETNFSSNNNDTIIPNNNNGNDKSATVTGGDGIRDENQKSPPRFSFYKDILDEKCNETDDNIVRDTSRSDECSKEGNNERLQSIPCEGDHILGQKVVSDGAITVKLESMDTSEHDTSITLSDGDIVSNQTKKPKPILCYVKKNTRKSVRWPEDDAKLEQVRFFELDETERINVTRPSADMKRFDMKHEAQMMSEARKCISYTPWKLIPIDLEPINVPVERGRDSREKLIQMERMKTTLESFYFHNQIPDNPDEPETNSYELLSDLNEKIKIIPLEDENATADRVQDYASINLVPTSINNEPNNNFGSANMSYVTDAVNYSSSGENSNYLSFNVAAATPSINQNFMTPNNTSFTSPSNGNFMPSLPTQNFDGGNPPVSNQNYSFNNFSNVQPVAAPQGPLQYTNSNPPGPVQGSTGPYNSDYNVPPNNNYGPSGFNQNSSPNNIYNAPPPPPVADNSTAVPNYYNNNPPNPINHVPSNNDNYSNNFWQETNSINNNVPGNNYAPPVGPPYQPPPGPRFRARGGPRGPRGGPGSGGFHSRNGLDICRFFLKTGKCKFENRCNFSHAIENSPKPTRFG